MKKLNILRLLILQLIVVLCSCNSTTKSDLTEKPNILFIHCDDLGYGDPGCYNPESKIPTPNMDRLAKEGIRFTDAHTPAAICGPSRQGLLTGCYPWRHQGKIDNGNAYDQVMIKEGRTTIPGLLRDNGYNTAIMGKWGVRFDWKSALKEGASDNPLTMNSESFDYSKPIHGPNIRGFDYSFCNIYFGNKEKAHPSGQGNNHWFFENGMICDLDFPKFDQFDYHNQQPRITQKTIDYLDVYAGKKENIDFKIDRSKPFFIYYATPAPHEPIVPNKEFKGVSKAGDYGDYVAELDYRIGQILKKLEELGLVKSTIVILSSDNGPEQIAYPRIQEYGHYSMGEWRGVKRDNWEGGNRVPFIVRWPEKILPNTVNSTPICLTDLLATFAEMVDTKLPTNQAEDSYSILSLLLKNKAVKYKRAPIVYHTFTRNMAIRDGDWVLIDAPSGMQSKEPDWFRKERGVKEHSEQVELFNLKNDPQQLENLASKYPEKVKELKAKLNDIMQKDTRPKSISGR